MDEDKKIKFAPFLPVKMNVVASRRDLVMQAVSTFVSDQKGMQNILPMPECLRTLHEMKSDAISQKRYVSKLPALNESKLSYVTKVLALSESNGVAVKSEFSADVTTGSMQIVAPIIIEGALAAKDIEPKKRLSQQVISKMKSSVQNMPRPVMLSSEKRPPPYPREICQKMKRVKRRRSNKN